MRREAFLRRSTRWVGMVLLTVLPQTVDAQEPADTVAVIDSLATDTVAARGAAAPDTAAVVRPGSRVRVTLSNRVAPAPLIGTVLRVDRDSLVVEREEGGMRALAPRHVDQIEVSVRKEHEPGRAVAYGLLTVGPLLAIGGAVLLLSDVGPEVSGPMASLLLAAAAGGIFAGWLIGGTSAQDVWIESRWPDVEAESGRADPPSAASDSLLERRQQ